MSKALSIAELANLLDRADGAYRDQPFPGTAPIGMLDEDGPGLAEAALGALVPVGHAASAPRHFSPDPNVAKATPATLQPGEDDPIRMAWKAGFEDGIATEKRVALEMRGEDLDALNHMRDQVRQIGAAGMQMLESRIRETVISLCRQVIDECPISAEKLSERVQAAVRMLAGSHDEKTIEVSPQDQRLLAGMLPAEWIVTGNPALARGALRVVTPGGGVEDGPDHWKLALEEAIRTC